MLSEKTLDKSATVNETRKIVDLENVPINDSAEQNDKSEIKDQLLQENQPKISADTISQEKDEQDTQNHVG